MKQIVLVVLIAMAPVLRGQNIFSINLPPCCAPKSDADNPFLRRGRKTLKRLPANVCN